MHKNFLWIACLYLLLGLGTLQAAASGVYKVQRVNSDDSLNMRSIAGTKGAVIGVIPFNGAGIVSSGHEEKLGTSTWAEIHWSGKSGWVNKYYLAADKQMLSQTSAVPRQAAVSAPTKPVKMVVAPSPPVPQAPQPRSVAQSNKPAGDALFMRCGGAEPFWSMHVMESQLVVKIMDGPEYRAPVEFRKQSENNTSIAVVAGRKVGQGTLTAAFLQKVEACSDNMSGKNYPYSVTAMLDGAHAVSGCCEMSNAK